MFSFKLLLRVVSVGLALALGLAVWLAPTEQTQTLQTVFQAPPEMVFAVVSNNRDWRYRTSLDDLRILETDDRGWEVWEERSQGRTIRFTTQAKEPPSFYAFTMQGEGFSGRWQARFEPLPGGGTRFTATEHIVFDGAFMRLMGWCCMDLVGYMRTYQEDVCRKLGERPGSVATDAPHG